MDQFFLQAAEEYSHKSLSGRLLDRVYRRLSIEMMQRLGYSKKDADTMFNDALALEAKLAEVCMTTEEQNNPEYLSKINN